MGKKADGTISGVNETTTTGSTGGEDSKATESERRTTGGSDGGRTTGETEETIISQVADVSDSKTLSREERNAIRRQQYADKKGGTVTTRKAKVKKPEVTTIDKSQLDIIFMTISSIVASRPDCEQWLLTPEEISSITTPLSAMMEESEQFKDFGKYSNQIALVVACASIFIPKLMVTMTKQKAKGGAKNVKSTERKQSTTERTDERENSLIIKKVDGRNDKDNSTNAKDDVATLPIPSIMPIG